MIYTRLLPAYKVAAKTEIFPEKLATQHPSSNKAKRQPRAGAAL
jgi:hypothetical protein